MQAIKARDKHKKDKNIEQYKLWRNKVKSLINHSKTDFLSETINNNHSNPRQLWKNLHDITGKTNDHQTAFIHDDSGNPIFEITANTFNQFFTSIHEQYQTTNRNEYDTTAIDLNIEIKIPDNVEFSISRGSTAFIQSQLENLKTNKATGIFDISAKFLKMAASIICKPLSHILNSSIQSGIYPEMLKKAKVTPIFKKGDKSDPNNYRPISVLPVISSIFERHISNCVSKFMDMHNLIYHHQSGFRKNHSCQTALTRLVDHWLAEINENNTVGVVLLDLKKAFDLVNHKIPLQKLRSYKFSNHSLGSIPTLVIEHNKFIYLANYPLRET